MKAVCITEPGSVSIAEIDTPQPGDGEVAIDVSMSDFVVRTSPRSAGSIHW